MTELGRRQLEVVELASHGLSNQQIARHMNISDNTVKTHLRKVSEALGISSRAGIVGECFRRGYLEVDRG